MKCLVSTIALLVLAGCAAPAPITATSNAISFEYHHGLTSDASIVVKAQEHCAQFGKVASLNDTTISPSGNWYTRTFDCE
jgi:uncharacterized lipoprotein YajG